MKNKREETDAFGKISVSNEKYWGAQTQRSLKNFKIGGEKMPLPLIRALGVVKLAASSVNKEMGILKPKIANAIGKAAKEVINGKLDDHFPLVVWQTGSGTQSNMNANEVISNRAIQILGGEIGSKNPVHPNDHCNLSQSSNDTFPSAMHIATALEISNNLIPAMEKLSLSLEKKSKEFWGIVKTGRTHLQDATPIRLGQEFKGYNGQIKNSLSKVNSALEELSVLALGGTAVGTGIGMDPEFCGEVIKKISNKTGINFTETENHFQSQSTIDGIVFASGCVRSFAVSLMKIANDIRWLGSGPRAGIGEISLPEVQPGSSIMPGKVNPVIAESVTMICAQVMGNDQTVGIAGQSGNFELNVMMPIAAHNLLESIEILASGSNNFSKQCIEGLVATDKGPNMVNQGLAICTALAPKLGYDKAANIAHIASENGETIKEVTLRETDLSSEEIDKILEPLSMTEPK